MAKRETVFVSMRLDAELVRQIDQLAEIEGLNRTDVIERLARREFTALRVVGSLAWFKQHMPGVPFWPTETETGMVEVLVSGGPAFKRKSDGRKGGRS